MTVRAITILICTTVLVVAAFSEPPKKQAGYGYSVKKEYHSAQNNNKHPHPYGVNEDQGYGDEQYGRVSVKKYGYKKEYEKDDKKHPPYEPSDSYHKPAQNSGYRSESYKPEFDDRKDGFPYHQAKPNTYKPRGYDEDRNSKFEPHRFTAQRGYNEHRNQKSFNRLSKPQPSGYNRNGQSYDNSYSSQPRGYGDDNKRQNQPYRPQGYGDDSVQHPHTSRNRQPYDNSYSSQPRGYGGDNKRQNQPYRPQGYGDDGVQEYKPQHPHTSRGSGYSEDRGYGPVRQPYQQREEKKYYKGYHKEEYHNSNNNKGYSKEPTYGAPPKQDLSKKKVIHEKHYYGQFGNSKKPERALGGFEGDLHAPVYRPHDDNSGYHGNRQANRQLRGYEAAFARQKYYQLAPHYNH